MIVCVCRRVSDHQIRQAAGPTGRMSLECLQLGARAWRPSAAAAPTAPSTCWPCDAGAPVAPTRDPSRRARSDPVESSAPTRRRRCLQSALH